jgi:hypothetical protein
MALRCTRLSSAEADQRLIQVLPPGRIDLTRRARTLETSMKTIRIDALSGHGFKATSFWLPAQYQNDLANFRCCRQQARRKPYGDRPALMRADGLRTIALSEGLLPRFASQAGALVTFVASGALALVLPHGPRLQLESGDVLFTDVAAGATLTAHAGSQTHLLQIGVEADWPGPMTGLDIPATIIPRRGHLPKVKRIVRGTDSRSRFADFEELFSAPIGDWSRPCRIDGFRFICWEDSDLDWRMGAIDQLSVVLSGEMQMDVGDARASAEVFRAGDICLDEAHASGDHRARFLGATYVAALALHRPG